MSMTSSSADLVCTETAEAEKSSASQDLDELQLFNQFTQLLCTSTETKNSEAMKVVKFIKSENGPVGLKNMSEDAFLEKAKLMLEHQIQRKLPFCSFCLKSFINSKNRDDHVKKVHYKIKEENKSCPMCDKFYQSKEALNYHIDVSHSGSSQVKCEVCDVKFRHRLSLKRHMKLHSKAPKIHQCDHCPKQFTRADNLTVHLKVVHMKVNIYPSMVELMRQDEESFACKVCDQVFSGEEAAINLEHHLVRKCRSEERFPCSECDKDFSSKFNMEQHKRNLHFEVTKNIFCCKYCDFISKHKNSMARHEKRKHKTPDID